jgi:hypothetical protein
VVRESGYKRSVLWQDQYGGMAAASDHITWSSDACTTQRNRRFARKDRV